MRVRERGRSAYQGADHQVELEHLFNGSALNAVDPKGRLSIPAFIRGVIERRSDAKAVVIGMHDVSPCLNAYDRGYARHLHLENERRRLREEGEGASPEAASNTTVKDEPRRPPGRPPRPR